jgi:hypothetical protein
MIQEIKMVCTFSDKNPHIIKENYSTKTPNTIKTKYEQYKIFLTIIFSLFVVFFLFTTNK